MTTNLSEIRIMGKVLYDAVPIQDAGYGIVQHPYVSSMFSAGDDGKLIDLNKEENLKEVRSKYFKIIDESDLLRNYMFIRTPWKLTWFKYVNRHLSEEDYSKYLEDAWVSEENPNMDLNVSRKESIGYFKKANKKFLMNEEDYEYYEGLPEELTVWRGVSPGREKYGLSWTDDKEKAEWFKERFEKMSGNKGILLEAKINKKDVLAYFNTRNEKELVVDVFKIKKQIIEVG